MVSGCGGEAKWLLVKALEGVRPPKSCSQLPLTAPVARGKYQAAGWSLGEAMYGVTCEKGDAGSNGLEHSGRFQKTQKPHGLRQLCSPENFQTLTVSPTLGWGDRAGASCPGSKTG